MQSFLKFASQKQVRSADENSSLKMQTKKINCWYNKIENHPPIPEKKLQVFARIKSVVTFLGYHSVRMIGGKIMPKLLFTYLQFRKDLN